MPLSDQPFVALANSVIDIEIEAIQGIKKFINADFQRACSLFMECKGRIIVTGMGKSGHIGRKIAATFASTGSPAFFVHPGEASHGDLGMITADDVVLAISNSGETQEVVTILPVIKRIGASMIAMTGKPSSTLATTADVHVCIAIEKEACPLGLAPTSSTTATLVMGDAIAVALLEARGFTEDDFALSHPGGSLGKKLLLTLEDIMHSGDKLPVVPQHLPIRDALMEISEKGLGMTAIVDDQGILAGLFTDGDLRRVLEAEHDLKRESIDSVMTRGCITAPAKMLAAEALNLMDQNKINGLIIVDEKHKPIGAMNMQDLLKAGVI